ncbi:unnamed protein product [Rotaria sp. Silwood1]|nr:unnamed protein product [Rotaria sp. Silwood1]CAF1192529.1 unnamed protein product [Rotaria sp. Silwood1]
MNISVSPPRRRLRRNHKQSSENSHDAETLTSLHDHASSIDRTSSNEVIEDVDLLNINADNISSYTEENRDKTIIQITTIINDSFVDHQLKPISDNQCFNDIVPFNDLSNNVLSHNHLQYNIDNLTIKDFASDSNQLKDINILSINGYSSNDRSLLDDNVVESHDDTENENSLTLLSLIMKLRKKRNQVEQKLDSQIEQAVAELKKVSNKLDELIQTKKKKNEEYTNKINELTQREKLCAYELNKTQVKQIQNHKFIANDK